MAYYRRGMVHGSKIWYQALTMCNAMEQEKCAHIAIELLNSRLNFLDRRHCHKPESSASSGQFVIDDL